MYVNSLFFSQQFWSWSMGKQNCDGKFNKSDLDPVFLRSDPELGNPHPVLIITEYQTVQAVPCTPEWIETTGGPAPGHQVPGGEAPGGQAGQLIPR